MSTEDTGLSDPNDSTDLHQFARLEVPYIHTFPARVMIVCR
jgi:hypothetical protein